MFFTFLISLILTVCKCIKKAIVTFALATILLILFLRSITVNTKFLLKQFSKENNSKIANQQIPHQSPPTTSEEPPTKPTNTQTNNPQSSTLSSFQDHPYTFEERHARFSESLEPVICQAPLSEPQYEPVYNIYPLSNKLLIEQDTKVKTKTRSKQTDKFLI